MQKSLTPFRKPKINPNKLFKSPYLSLENKKKLSTSPYRTLFPRTGRSLSPSKHPSQEQHSKKPFLLRQLRPNRLVTEHKGQEQPRWRLSQQQMQTFGDRCPKGYRKICILGKGGFSIVWECQRISNLKRYAVKQIPNSNKHNTQLKELQFCQRFFLLGGRVKDCFASRKGIQNLTKMITSCSQVQDTWIVYELCGKSLGSQLFKMQLDNLDRKLYYLSYQSLVQIFKQDPEQLNLLILGIAQALDLISQNGLIHSDVKTQNILVQVMDKKIVQVKLIDYGSSFEFNNLKNFSMATPQYMSPQILNYILHQNGMEADLDLLGRIKKYHSPWVVDVWSLGCVLLQIFHGVPLWMSLPTRVNKQTVQGLFAVKGRIFKQIIEKQMRIVNNLQATLKSSVSQIRPSKQQLSLLKRMLDLHPERRPSPRQIINQLS